MDEIPVGIEAFESIFNDLVDADRTDIWDALRRVFNCIGEQPGMCGLDDFDTVIEWLQAERGDLQTFIQDEQSADEYFE